jgi:hypothetical protein
VFLNGVKLDDSDFTATNGTSVTLNVPCVATDDVDIVAFGAVPQLANAGGLPNYVVGTTAGGTALEYKQIVAGTGVSIAQGVGSLTISAGGSPLSAPLASFRYIASANQTVFTGSDSNGNPLGFTPGFLYVFVNGVLLAPSLDYTTTSTTTITLTSGCSLSDFIDILAFGQVTTVGLTDSSVTTAKIADGSVTSAKLAAGAAVPSQTGNAGLYLTTNGTTASWATSPTGFRNRIINGDMRIDQRNAGAEVNPAVNAAYYVDRWSVASTVASKFKIGQNAGAVTPPDGYTNYLGATSLSAYTVGADEVFAIRQFIEGSNVSDLAWGTASAKTVTLSFWVRSSLTGLFGGAVSNSDQNRSYPFSYTISVANTWEQKSITIEGDTTGTWLKNSGRGMRSSFSLGSGATYSGTAGTWAAGNLLSATGATSVVGTNGATFYITGVQLEAGSTATDFERRPIGTELALCQRYFQSYGGQSANDMVCMGATNATSYFLGILQLPVTMRTSPTVGFSAASALSIDDNGSGGTSSVITTGSLGCTSIHLAVTTGATMVINRPARCYTNGSSARLTWSAEL